LARAQDRGRGHARAAALLAGGLLVALVFALLPTRAGALVLPPGFQARALPLPKASGPTYVNGLQKPSTLEFAPDGTMFVAERNGRILAFDSVQDATPTLVANILDEVHAAGDRGILGMKLDPEYPEDPYIYLSYTYDAPIGGDSDDSTHPHLADGSDSCDTGSDSGCLVSGRLARIEIDPATKVAVGGAQEPPQEVLINSWCQQKLSHSIGDIEFDSSGALLMSGGEGASWSTPDFGQLENPCDDPPNEGGSLRSQDVRTAQTASDPTDYSGTLIRVDPDTGQALPDNPFSVTPLENLDDEVDANAPRILAYGMRNPFRFAIKPGSDDVYIGDVGWEEWEEINHLTAPPATGQEAVNFGWPCFEGGPSGSLVNSRWNAVDKPLCESLYDEPGAVRAPLFAYPHPFTPGYDGHLFPGDACDPSAGSSVAGLFFYDATGVDPAVVLPEKYQGALFFTDASRGCIWTMEEGADGQPDPATIENFLVHESGDSLFTPVEIVQGPDGALYVPNFYFDEIWQIRYFPGNQAPTLDLDVDKTYGELPLKVKFDASGSSDPDAGDHLAYAWDLNGDGEFSAYGSASVAEHEYLDPVNVSAGVRIKDDFNHVETKTVLLYPGDEGPPAVTIEKPTTDLEWVVGQPFEYAATATDPDDESFGSGLTPHWEFRLKHCPDACHEHLLNNSDSASGTFAPEEHEFPSHLRLLFTATDSRGMSTSAEVEVFPREIEIGVDSDPAGIPLTINGVTASGRFGTETMAGGKVNVAAPASAEVDSQPYVFASWSDGGERIHDATSLDSVDLVAHFVPKPPEPEPEPEQPQPKQPPPGPEPPVAGGGGGSSAGPPAPAPPALARVQLGSRPAGVKLRLGEVRAPAPLSAELPLGTETFVLAPPAIRRQGKRLPFQKWVLAGRSLGAARRQPLKVSGDARYLAIYGRR
jgi:glucose/arabinose dehydrogenase